MGTGVAPPSLGRSRNMAAIRRSDTKPEVALRSALHRQGLRFRKDYPVRVEGRLIRPDIAFTRQRIAVFVDGCFWHSCPMHGRQPRKNTAYWGPKLDSNTARDRQQTALLEAAGWRVLRFWEHEPLETVADQIGQTVRGDVRDSPVGLSPDYGTPVSE
nr:very short patch repair endonuclease [Gordonia rhizosphera]